MRRLMFALFWLIAALPARAELPQAETVQPVDVLHTGDDSDGVVLDHDGNLYLSHGPIITKWDPEGKAETWAETGAPIGHKVLADGTHLVCDSSRHAVLHLDARARELAPASTESDGEILRSPNDLTLGPHGGFYFTDPGGSALLTPIGTVHYVGPDQITHTVATGLAFPTGIVLRPDGQALLVSESRKNRILSYPVLTPGKLGEPRVLVELPAKGEGQTGNFPDGLAFDGDGNLYVAHNGMRQVQVVGPGGELLRSYPAGNLRTSNLAFGGPRRDQLYLTGGNPGSLFRLDLPGVQGQTILPDQDQ